MSYNNYSQADDIISLCCSHRIFIEYRFFLRKYTPQVELKFYSKYFTVIVLYKFSFAN